MPAAAEEEAKKVVEEEEDEEYTALETRNAKKKEEAQPVFRHPPSPCLYYCPVVEAGAALVGLARSRPISVSHRGRVFPHLQRMESKNVTQTKKLRFIDESLAQY